MYETTGSSDDSVEKYGWTSVPHDQSVLLQGVSPWDPADYTIAQMPFPESAGELTSKVASRAIAQKHLPSFLPSMETYYLACLLHDIGTTEENLHSTHLSFEFYGGYLALTLLQEYGAPKEQAESVAEAIIRHQDLGDVGNITTVGQLIQLATLFDNVGGNPTLISKGTIETVVAYYPRGNWSSCFSHVIGEELKLKPWAHSSAIPKFAETVANNKLMEPWDKEKSSQKS
ncbi:hypothetical protein GRF29_161g1267050 [Pseudopithomyces chartarum]|uniref:HD domain-containing protein n=1 Tax=Pseudopithomyces chartarum TaxID=1892770 RepID=A0AAN6RDE9_9PLEO|nr:hypothetical protein GRF29_161g1267050 [Pseudopithomyces chartarum]